MKLPASTNKFSTLLFLSLIIYFLLAFTSVVMGKKSEIFPFFSFKLYTVVPSEIKLLDLATESNINTPLIQENSDLSGFEKRALRNVLKQVVAEKISKDSLLANPFLMSNFSGQEGLVIIELNGSPIEAAQTGKANATPKLKLQ